uniref:DUF4776 domain-containing protein n=1 Tax=Bracon brevicornis TaxID=1563983 RepID=A0A6V7IKY2_9HYME
MSDGQIPVLEPPEIPPQISMNDPAFDNLTEAEKLNDREYRSKIYQKFPNEPTCKCPKNSHRNSGNSNKKFTLCPADCTNGCCNRRSQRSVTQKNNAKDNADYCNGRRPSNLIHNDAHCLENGKRLRGGGCEDFSRSGGLDCGKMPGMPVANSYKTINPGNYSGDKFDLNFEGRKTCRVDPLEFCEKNPCVGVDCLIRAFKETQEFVDSLGKVPGLAGLGLSSPSGNLYTRSRIKPSEEEILEMIPSDLPKQRKIGSRFQRPHLQQQNDLMKTKPFTLPSAGRRPEPLRRAPEAFPFEMNKPEEGILEEGSGPCGQTCCRSRRKKKDVTTSSHEILKSSKGKKNSKKSLRGRKNKNEKRHSPRGNQDHRKRIKWIYLAGDTYPGISYGHKNCNDPRKRVPANMGWMWSAYGGLGRLKPRAGWRPGALSRTIKEIFKETRAGMLEDSRSRSAMSRGVRSIKSRSQTSMKRTQSKKLDEEEDVEPPPTLHVLRRDGTYYVTMYPIKQDTMDVPKLEEPMKPLQFKIPKNRDNCSETSSSTASDIEIEFSPPAAVNRYRRKPDVVHVDTQVKQQEILEAFKPPSEKKKEKKGKKGKK